MLASMTGEDLTIDPEVARAHTLPARIYRDPVLFERMRERVFARAWHLLPEPPEREHVRDRKSTRLNSSH